MDESKMVEKVIYDFDWVKVYRYMNDTNWTYGDKGIPSIPLLKETE